MGEVTNEENENRIENIPKCSETVAKREKKRISYNNGRLYDGEMQDGKRNGLGAYIDSNGDIYSGEWVNGKRNGTGSISYKDGSEYAGEWMDNKRHGKGIITYSNGEIYE